MKLYYHPVSTYAQKAMIAFYEKNAAFTPEIVQMMDPKAKAEYKKIYPMGKIPLLVLDDGWMIPESSIIIEYLDENHLGGAKLIPEDKNQARQVRFWDRMCDQYLNVPCSAMFVETVMKPAHERNHAAVEDAKARLDVMYEALAKQLSGRTWIFGENFTMADCSAAPALFYLNGLHPFGRHAQIASYLDRLTARPSFAKVLQEAAPYLEAFQKGGKAA